MTGTKKMDVKRATMKSLLEQKLGSEGLVETGVKGVALFRRDNSYRTRPQFYNPQIIMLAQGKKNIYLGDKQYVYDPQHYYVQTLPLPVHCEAVIEDNKPMLGMVINIDPQIIGEIIVEMETGIPSPKRVNNSLYDAPLTEPLIDAAVRLLQTMESKNETRILGPIFLKELLYKVISGENGEIIRELAVNNRGFYQISRVISKIHDQYSHPIEINALAKEAGMSATAFHTSFKAMTSTSPLQYIKNVRLHKAKEMIQREGEKANAAAMRVGYESPSQFSREYKRCFGTTPASDRQHASGF